MTVRSNVGISGFPYEAGREILHGIDMKFPKGEALRSIVGEVRMREVYDRIHSYGEE